MPCIRIACPPNNTPVACVGDSHANHRDEMEDFMVAEHIRPRIWNPVHEYEATDALDYCIHDCQAELKRSHLVEEDGEEQDYHRRHNEETPHSGSIVHHVPTNP